MDDNKFYTVRGYQLLDQSKSKLTPSLEDYLEMIYRNIIKNGYIRVNKLAFLLNVKPSSVSKMIIKLSNMGFIDYEKYGIIKLTDKGNELGSYLMWRHNVINDFFSLISSEELNNTLAETELVEHNLSKETVKNLQKILELFKSDQNLINRLKNINI